jgi:hypothetical protein
MALRSRFADVNRGTVKSLLVGDLVALSAFLLIGEISHGIDPVADAGRVVLVAVPFLLGWVVCGSLAGAYSVGVLDSPRDLLVTTLLGWLLGDAFGQLLRSTATLPGNADPAFFAVAFAFGSVFLLAHRGVRLVARRLLA